MSLTWLDDKTKVRDFRYKIMFRGDEKKKVRDSNYMSRFRGDESNLVLHKNPQTVIK